MASASEVRSLLMSPLTTRDLGGYLATSEKMHRVTIEQTAANRSDKLRSLIDRLEELIGKMEGGESKDSLLSNRIKYRMKQKGFDRAIDLASRIGSEEVRNKSFAGISRELIRQGAYEVAQSVISRISSCYVRGELLSELAFEFLELENTDKAEECLSMVAGLIERIEDPDDKDFLLGDLICYRMKEGDIDRAVDLASRIESKGSREDAFARIFRSLIGGGFYEIAERVISSCLFAGSLSYGVAVEFLELGELDRAERVIQLCSEEEFRIEVLERITKAREEMGASSVSSFCSLPETAIQRVMSFLEIKDLGACLATSKEVHRVTIKQTAANAITKWTSFIDRLSSGLSSDSFKKREAVFDKIRDLISELKTEPLILLLVWEVNRDIEAKLFSLLNSISNAEFALIKDPLVFEEAFDIVAQSGDSSIISMRKIELINRIGASIEGIEEGACKDTLLTKLINYHMEQKDFIRALDLISIIRDKEIRNRKFAELSRKLSKVGRVIISHRARLIIA